MARFSTGLRNSLAADYGLGILMNGGIIRVYGGTRPTVPDNPPDSPLLGLITTEGKIFFPVDDPNEAGLLLSLVSPGILVNNGNWRLTGEANGHATWWRWSWRLADTLKYTTIYPRVDGLINSELVLANTAITTTTSVEIEDFVFSLGLGT